jgi:hypothetical protein
LRKTRPVDVFRYRQERTERMEEIAVDRFNQIVESDILPLFRRTAELLQDNCMVQMRHQERTAEGPFVVSVAMMVTPKEGVRMHQPYQKMDLCLREKTLKVVIFTELQRPGKLEIEEIDLADLNITKLEQCVRDFVADIFQ